MCIYLKLTQCFISTIFQKSWKKILKERMNKEEKRTCVTRANKNFYNCLSNLATKGKWKHFTYTVIRLLYSFFSYLV